MESTCRIPDRCAPTAAVDDPAFYPVLSRWKPRLPTSNIPRLRLRSHNAPAIQSASAWVVLEVSPSVRAATYAPRLTLTQRKPAGPCTTDCRVLWTVDRMILSGPHGAAGEPQPGVVSLRLGVLTELSPAVWDAPLEGAFPVYSLHLPYVHFLL